MIKNIIFDLGGVLIVFDMDYFLRKRGVTDETDLKLIKDILFYKEKLWLPIDSGEWTEEKTAEEAEKLLPERLKAPVRDAILNWPKPQPELIPEMHEFVRQAYKKGYNLYILSNAPCSAHDYIHDLPDVEFIKDIIISADIKMAKPDPEIFRFALNKFNLQAEETLFIDDNMMNIKGAESVGITGALYRRKEGIPVTVEGLLSGEFGIHT